VIRAAPGRTIIGVGARFIKDERNFLVLARP
jgi:hypothetical protein